MTGTGADQPLVLPVDLVLPTAADTEALGRRLARRLRAGDLVLLSGELGAGKTTLARGLGAALGVRGDVTSPTFVIARVHPSLTGGPALVHVDAYRLGSTWPRSTTSTWTPRSASR
jgi:tRNA threonylcarbamoyladenosine biosynthesis protein TsaE